MAQQYELNFQDYWRIIRKRRHVIIFTFLVIFLSTIVYLNLLTPIYRASSTIKVEQHKTLANALLDFISWSPGDVMITEAKVIESRLIAEEVVRRLGLVKDDATLDEFNQAVSTLQASISTEKVKDTNLIHIIVFSSNPKRAMLIANEVAKVYIEHDRERKIKQARQVREFIERQLTTVQTKLKSSEEKLKRFKEQDTVAGMALLLQDKLAKLRFELAELLFKATEKHPQVERLREQIQDLENQLESLPANEIEFARLTLDMNVNVKLYTVLREKFEEARIVEAEKTEDASIVEYATIPKSPDKPNKKGGLIFGMLGGLMFGLVFSFVIEGMDASIGNIEDVESLLKLPVLGVIPHVWVEEKKPLPWWRKGFLQPRPTKLDEIRVRLIVHDQPKSPVTETYRTLRTNLKLTSPGRKTLLIVSAGPKEGKTTILVNLALTAAQMGNKTLIVSSDLRRPALYQTFGLKREPGLSEVLSQTIKWQEVVRSLSDILIGEMNFDQVMKTPGLDNLSILTSGQIPLNPSELLGSKEMFNLIEELKTKFDVVLFDSPPILPITDAILLASKVDGVLIVYEMGRTARGALLRAKNQLESSGAKVLGVVLNHTQPDIEMYPAYYPHYYRDRYYGRDKKKSHKGVA